MKKFEFNKIKSNLNLNKHGIDFIDAQSLWDDPDFIEVQEKSDDEPRYLVIGIITKKYWSAIITYRGDSIRIISVRRSRMLEVKLYES